MYVDRLQLLSAQMESDEVDEGACPTESAVTRMADAVHRTVSVQKHVYHFALIGHAQCVRDYSRSQN